MDLRSWTGETSLLYEGLEDTEGRAQTNEGVRDSLIERLFMCVCGSSSDWQTGEIQRTECVWYTCARVPGVYLSTRRVVCSLFR